MYSSGLELTTPSFTGRRSNHFAMKDSRFGWSTFLIYRQPIFNTDKTVSRQSELFLLPFRKYIVFSILPDIKKNCPFVRVHRHSNTLKSHRVFQTLIHFNPI